MLERRSVAESSFSDGLLIYFTFKDHFFITYNYISSSWLLFLSPSSGFGWGGLSLHAAKKYGCHVTGITLSVEQKALAEERVEKEGLGHLINFEVIDYRTFARRQDNRGKFDRVISCEMIEAVGHEHLGEL